MSIELIFTFILFSAVALYVLTGGADYGAGIWNIFVSKKLADRQRELITMAIQPIWEANHVWLILVVVLLFSAYPAVYSYICTTLNIPISLALFGVVMRGTAFISGKYDPGNDKVTQAWGAIFAGASVITPFLFGAMIGAISAGRLVMPSDKIWETLFAPWLSPYCVCLGGFTLAIFSMLAAVYLTVDAQGDAEVQSSFRSRALISQGIVAVFAVLTVIFAGQEHTWIFKRIAQSPLAIVCHAVFVIGFAATTVCLLLRRFKIARILAAGEALIILLGYALAQFPFLVPPDYTIYNSSAPHTVLTYLLVALGLGAVTLFPSLLFLFRIFKGDGEHATQGAPMH